MKKKIAPMILLLILVIQSCTTRKQMLYLQDVDDFSNTMVNYSTTKIQPNDVLKIDISDLNPIVAAPFNTNNGSSSGQTSVEMMKLTGYLVTP